MPITADKPNNSQEYELVPKGTHVARVYKVIYLGTQKIEWQGETKELKKVRLYWELPNEKKTYTTEDGEEKEGVLSISREFTLSMGGKANLRPIVEGIIGTALQDEEAYSFNMEELVGKACLIRITHKKNKAGDREYAIVESTSELMKGQECPKQVNDSVIINAGNITKEDLEKLPDYIKEKIESSPEFKNRGIEYPSDEIDPADIPF